MAMRLEEIDKAWEHEPKRPITRELTFDGDFLVLGAQTRLAKVGAPVDEPRLGALLGAAHGARLRRPRCVTFGARSKRGATARHCWR
jgi:hypothetical protein